MRADPGEEISENKREAVTDKKKKNYMYIMSGVIIVGILAAAAWFQFGNGTFPWSKNNLQKQEVPRYLIPVKELQVNLADKGSRRYIRFKIYLSSSDKDLMKEVEQREPELRSCLITILRNTAVNELDGENGMALLKNEILEQANSLFATGKVEEVFFDEFIIQ